MLLTTALSLLAASGMAAPPIIPIVLPEPCPAPSVAVAKRSCTWEGGPIYLQPGDKRAALLHELGHHFDYQAMGDSQRDTFRGLIDDGRPWHTSPNSPHEQFAEAYALCALRPRLFNGRVEGDYDYGPTLRRHHRICLLIRRAGVLAHPLRRMPRPIIACTSAGWRALS